MPKGVCMFLDITQSWRCCRCATSLTMQKLLTISPPRTTKPSMKGQPSWPSELLTPTPGCAVKKMNSQLGWTFYLCFNKTLKTTHTYTKISLFKKQSDRGRAVASVEAMLHSARPADSQGWTRLNPGAMNYICVSCVCSRDPRTPLSWLLASACSVLAVTVIRERTRVWWNFLCLSLKQFSKKWINLMCVY